jgi:L-rhamnose isomerase/sugar isomerase
MIDQSHNVTDPIESLIGSAMEILRAYIQASLINRGELAAAQDASDVMLGHRLVKQAFITDVSPILAEARRRKGGAIDPLACYRASGYRAAKARERPVVAGTSAGIV